VSFKSKLKIKETNILYPQLTNFLCHALLGYTPNLLDPITQPFPYWLILSNYYCNLKYELKSVAPSASVINQFFPLEYHIPILIAPPWPKF